MKWEITDNRPKRGDIRFKTKFAFLPTRVLSRLTLTDHIIWLELYIEEQEWMEAGHDTYAGWYPVARTIHV